MISFGLILIIDFFFSLKIESKKLDFKEKAKPRTDSGKQETMTSGGGGGEASATVNEEHETSDEVFESQKTNNGDK